MPIFRPSMVINMTLEFDEAFTGILQPKPESVQDLVNNPPKNAAAAKGQIKPLYTLASPASFLLARIPKSGSVEMPGYRQAASFNFTFDYRDFPIDPRAVRAAAIEVHMGVVSDDDYAYGADGRSKDGSLRTVLRTRDSSGNPNASTHVMTGSVDEWETSHDNSGSVVNIKGRDLRGILIDTPIDIVPGAQTQMLDHLDLGRPIDEVVKHILEFNQFFGGIAVVCNPAEWPDGRIPDVSTMDSAPRHRKGASGKKKPRATPPASVGATNFWDLIVRFCFLVGAIPYFQGTNLYIRPSRTIFDQARNSVDPVRNPTPFKDGLQRTYDHVSNTAITPGLKFRRFVYGRDVVSLKFHRKFAGFHKPKIVRCVGTDGTKDNMIIEASWPEVSVADRAKVCKTSPGGKAATDILNIPVSGVRDIAKLKEIARSIYEETGRGEQGGTLETPNLSSFGGDNADPDCLRLRTGDGIELMVDTRAVGIGSPLTSTYTDFNRLSLSELTQEIKSRVGDERLALAIVATQRGQYAEMQRYFRVANVKFNWSDKGIKITFDYQNYFVARNQIEKAPSTPGTVTKLTAAGVPPKAAPNSNPGQPSYTRPTRK